MLKGRGIRRCICHQFSKPRLIFRLSHLIDETVCYIDIGTAFGNYPVVNGLDILFPFDADVTTFRRDIVSASVDDDPDIDLADRKSVV